MSLTGEIVVVDQPFIGIARIEEASYPTLYFSSDTVFDLNGESLKQEFSEALSGESIPEELASFICELLQLEWTKYLVVEKPESHIRNGAKGFEDLHDVL